MKKIIAILLLSASCIFGFSKSYVVHIKGDVYKINGSERLKLEREVELDEEDEIEIYPNSSATIVVEGGKIKINYGKGKIKNFVSSN